jgi:hypothetical protein
VPRRPRTTRLAREVVGAARGGGGGGVTRAATIQKSEQDPESANGGVSYMGSDRFHVVLATEVLHVTCYKSGDATASLIASCLSVA